MHSLQSRIRETASAPDRTRRTQNSAQGFVDRILGRKRCSNVWLDQHNVGSFAVLPVVFAANAALHCGKIVLRPHVAITLMLNAFLYNHNRVKPKDDNWQLGTGYWQLTRFLHHLGIRCQRQQREVLPVEVILQIEHTRKAGARAVWLVPRAIFLLRAQQVRDPTGH
jgi:hypothetical protein